MWEPETKTLIASDLVFNKQFPYGVDGTCNPTRLQQIIDELISLQPNIIISGHGPSATIEDLKEISEFLRNRIQFSREKLEKGYTLEKIQNDSDLPDYHSQDHAERKDYTIEHWFEFLKENV